MMSLGSYVFAVNPADLTGMFTKERSSAHVKTYASVGFFSWGVSIVGKVITLEWEYMPRSMFDSLQTLLETDSMLILNPDLESGKTYYVEIVRLDGKYYQTQGNVIDGTDAYRKDVRLELLIMSEAS